MTNRDNSGFIIGLVFFVLALILGFCLGLVTGKDIIKENAIKAGVARNVLRDPTKTDVEFVFLSPVTTNQAKEAQAQ